MFKINIEKLVPRFILNDKNGYAIAKAIEAGLQMMNDAIEQGVKCAVDYDAMPEWRLDELAWELDIDWYDYTYPVETKRRLIKNCTHDKERNGTKAAVLSVLRSIFGNAEIEEWFEYGGDPFTFRTEIGIPEGLTEEQQLRALENVEYYKNVRSVFGKVNYTYESSGELKTGAGTVTTALVDILPGVADEVEITAEEITSGIAVMDEKLNVYPQD